MRANATTTKKYPVNAALRSLSPLKSIELATTEIVGAESEESALASEFGGD